MLSAYRYLVKKYKLNDPPDSRKRDENTAGNFGNNPSPNFF
jgi:hypothetical protein